MMFSTLLLATIASAGIVHVPLTVRDSSEAPEVAEYLQARNIYHDTQVRGFQFYEAVVEIGTPAQKVTTCFDTGSPHLWVPGTNSTDCVAGKCVSSYDVSKSSTWKYNKEGANWGGKGFWGKDSMAYAGQPLTDFNIYVSKDKFANNLGIFGQSGEDDPKKSFVKGLADQGKISRAIYSLNAEKPVNWRDKTTEGTVNNVYYGGFDRKKYEGPLVTIECDHHGGYAMPLGGLSIQGEKQKLPRDDHQIVLDTGGISLGLPNATLKRISEKFGGDAVYETPGYWKVACGSKPSITYNFGYTEIEVDMSLYVYPSPHGGCRLEGVSPNKDTDRILLTGPALISRALVIYDNDRDTITIAKAKYTSESDVVEITGDIPGAVLYKDWLAGKPLPGASSSSKTSTIPASSVAPKSSSVAPKSSSVAPKTSVAPTTSKASSAAPKSSTLAIKTTSTSTQPQPQPTPTPTDDGSNGGNQWCSWFGTFCVHW